ncbi:MAG: hypothetical protein EZS28_017520, partial [Streblomastix strix]
MKVRPVRIHFAESFLAFCNPNATAQCLSFFDVAL